MTRAIAASLVVALLAGVDLVASGGGVRVGGARGEAPEAESEAAASGWDRRLSETVSPGPLARAHLDLEGMSQCTECHTWLGGTPDASCLACHEDVGERMDARSGFHGRLEGRCISCHADHRGIDADLLGLDREGFAHDQALFALRGAHADVPCDDCHLRQSAESGQTAFHAIGVPQACADCHEGPHAERLVRERSCEACHVDSAWGASPGPEEVGFDHDADARFALDATHGGLGCTACHEDGVVPPPARECASCHPDAAALLAGRFAGREAKPDPHVETTRCADCHPATLRRPSLPEYAAVCVECHPASYAPLLATRRALVDEALVAARLATERPSDLRRLERLARSGLHHAELAEALALELARGGSP